MSSDTENTTDVKSHNIGQRLSEAAARYPDSVAIAIPPKRPRNQGRADYETMTFRELEADSSRIAAGLQAMGIEPGHRIVLMVRPGLDFISLTFALFKTAATVVLIDPGMGREHLIQCLSDVKPDGFVGI